MVGLLGAPLNDAYMQKTYKGSGETDAYKILEYSVKYWALVMIIISLIFLLL